MLYNCTADSTSVLNALKTLAAVSVSGLLSLTEALIRLATLVLLLTFVMVMFTGVPKLSCWCDDPGCSPVEKKDKLKNNF